MCGGRSGYPSSAVMMRSAATNCLVLSSPKSQINLSVGFLLVETAQVVIHGWLVYLCMEKWQL